MANRLQRICGLLLLTATLPGARAFVLDGPIANGGDAYQTTTLSYNLPGDQGAPKNLGEEYRRNIPVLYYSFDQNFLEYFGAIGANGVDQAVAVYNALTNVSRFTPDLSEFPLQAREMNPLASALHLYDVKSVTMNLLIEQLGLAQPERWTWELRDRFLPPGAQCPNYIYYVIRRNWDPTTFEPSAYVNGTLLNFRIFEQCPNPDQADAVEITNDDLAPEAGAVASFGATADYGIYLTGLTRDDAAGLRYLWRTNNINVESAGAGVTQIFTNTAALPTILTTSNLATLAADALTNDAAGLQAIYPNLVILGTTNYFALAVTTNLVAYFTNLPWAPAGSPATLVTYPVYTTNLVTRFIHSFGNVVTNHYYTNGALTTITVTTNNCYSAPVGSPCPPVTNALTVIRPMLMGDYYIIPTNTCGISIVSVLWSNVIAFTNIVVATNAPGVTNVNDQQFSLTTVTYFTNFQYAVKPVLCFSNSVALRQGMEKIRFVRRDFDSEFGQFFYPTNHSYTNFAVTNNNPIAQQFQRLVVAPDILFTATDLGIGSITRTVNRNTANTLPGLAGPGTIEPPVTFVFNKVGPLYIHTFGDPFLGGENPDLLNFQWASYDGTTNLPVVYPSGRSLEELENQFYLSITPIAPLSPDGSVQLPDGNEGSPYPAAFPGGFGGTGGLPPYSWELSPNSPGGLPPGLSFNGSGGIVGNPAAGTAGNTYPFVVRMTDSAARFVDRPYVIKINP